MKSFQENGDGFWFWQIFPNSPTRGDFPDFCPDKVESWTLNPTVYVWNFLKPSLCLGVLPRVLRAVCYKLLPFVCSWIKFAAIDWASFLASKIRRTVFAFFICFAVPFVLHKEWNNFFLYFFFGLIIMLFVT